MYTLKGGTKPRFDPNPNRSGIIPRRLPVEIHIRGWSCTLLCMTPPRSRNITEPTTNRQLSTLGIGVYTSAARRSDRGGVGGTRKGACRAVPSSQPSPDSGDYSKNYSAARPLLHPRAPVTDAWLVLKLFDVDNPTGMLVLALESEAKPPLGA